MVAPFPRSARKRPAPEGGKGGATFLRGGVARSEQPNIPWPSAARACAGPRPGKIGRGAGEEGRFCFPVTFIWVQGDVGFSFCISQVCACVCARARARLEQRHRDINPRREETSAQWLPPSFSPPSPSSSLSFRPLSCPNPSLSLSLLASSNATLPPSSPLLSYLQPPSSSSPPNSIPPSPRLRHLTSARAHYGVCTLFCI